MLFKEEKLRLGSIVHLPEKETGTAAAPATGVTGFYIINADPAAPLLAAARSQQAICRPQQVGAAGRVIGVDMTPEMLAKARVINLSPDKAQVFAEIEAMLHQAGFSAVSVEIKEESRAFPKAVAS